MKQFLPISVLLAGQTVCFSQANSYFMDDPVWTIRSECRVSDNCIKTTMTNYYTNGDTLISGSNYKKIYKKFIAISNDLKIFDGP